MKSCSRNSRAILEEAARRGLKLPPGADRPPLWTPYPDSPQERALASDADVIGFGGQAGGGKSDLLIGLGVQHHHKGIIFRRLSPLLKDLIARAREVAGQAARYNGQDKLLRWADGHTLEFGYIQHESDKNKYRGRPHDAKLFDELTEFTESQFRFLIGWTRTTRPGQRCRVVCTFNPPSTAAGRWVVRYFAPWVDKRHHNPAKPGELRWFAMVDGEEVERPDGSEFEHGGERIRPQSRTFFSAKLSDNPRLMATGYGRTLMALPEPLRSQLLHGDFDADAEVNPWQLIPTKWVEAAMARWRERGEPAVKLGTIGMDVAHGGADQTVFAPRHGDFIARLHKHPGRTTPDGKSAAALAFRLYEPGCTINVDAIGYGASAHEHLADMEWAPPGPPPPARDPDPDTGDLVRPPRILRPVPAPARPHKVRAMAVNVASKSHYRDRSGKYRMINVRAEMYWRLREALDPEFGSTFCLPDDPELLADLTAPTYEITPQGIKVESKDDIKARMGGRSPDAGDAACLSMLGDDVYGFL